MILTGVDLAWKSEGNPSAIAYEQLDGNTLAVLGIDSAVQGISEVCNRLSGVEGLQGLAIDAPLIIRNNSGQRACETGVGGTYSKIVCGYGSTECWVGC